SQLPRSSGNFTKDRRKEKREKLSSMARQRKRREQTPPELTLDELNQQLNVYSEPISSQLRRTKRVAESRVLRRFTIGKLLLDMQNSGCFTKRANNSKKLI